MSLVSLVVPVYGNALSLPDLLARFRELAARNPQDRFEFVFVDDAAPDQSFAVLEDRQVCDVIKNIRESNAYLVGLVLWVGFNPAVLSYHRRRRERKYGTSMWTLAGKLKYFIDSFVAFSSLPVRAASLLGIGLS